jgi:hypothetical protein
VNGNDFWLNPIHPDEIGPPNRGHRLTCHDFSPYNGDGQVMNAESDADGLAVHKDKSMGS